MIRKEIKFEFGECDVADLSTADAQLLETAIQSSATAYAPYSGFNVGAAVLLVDGTVVSGSNQENVAYPSGLCAERVALFSAGATYPGVEVDTIAIVAQTARFPITGPLTPCGGCRQVIMEYRNRQQRPIRLILAGGNKAWIINDATVLLPFAFQADGLKNGPMK